MILNLDRVTPFCMEYQGIGSTGAQEQGAESREQGCSELPITHYQLPITNYHPLQI